MSLACIDSLRVCIRTTTVFMDIHSQSLELAAHAKDTKGGRASTVQELATLCNGLQQENCMMKQTMQRQEHVATKLAEAAAAKAEVDARVQVGLLTAVDACC